jgi:aryl-alcohol dehydrogenase-like predicted oxidoreductase
MHMQIRSLGSQQLPAIGLGCMNLSHAYGVPPTPEVARNVLLRAFELGVRHFDTAALYGFGRNETLLGETLAPFRHEIFLASKCGITGVEGRRVVDGRPETIKQTCIEALQRLRTDVIDLYYLHRWDKNVPVEESVGALCDLVCAGHIRGIGLSEVSAATLRKAHAVHPLTAIQNEYSLWSRNPEMGTLSACAELNIAFVAFSPLGRGFLANSAQEAQSLDAKDIRRGMPRFQGENFRANEILLRKYCAIADEAHCAPAQLALAWLLDRSPNVLVIPGTTSIAHLESNVATPHIDTKWLRRVDELISPATVSGERYPQQTLAEIDTEEYRLLQ